MSVSAAFAVLPPAAGRHPPVNPLRHKRTGQKAMKAVPYTYTTPKWDYNPQTRRREKVGMEERTVEAASMFDVNKAILCYVQSGGFVTVCAHSLMGSCKFCRLHDGAVLQANFLDITKDSKQMFEGLAISQNTELCKKWMNQCPVDWSYQYNSILWYESLRNSRFQQETLNLSCNAPFRS